MDILKKLVSGKLSLAVTFWVYYFGFIVIATISLGISGGIALSGIINKPVLYCIFIVTVIIELFMIIAVIVGISRILKYQGVTFWRIAALIVCAIHCIGIIGCFLNGDYSYNGFLDKYPSFDEYAN